MSFSIESSLLFFLCLSLFTSLNGFEFVKNILIMQNRMGKLILKVINRQQPLDALLNNGIRQDLVDIRPLLRLYIEHSLQNTLNALTEVRRDVRILAHDDLTGELMQGLGVEWRVQGAHLIQ